MLVGGKPEDRETPRETALREVKEEIGIELAPFDLEMIGMWQTPAANEAGRDVHGTVFLVTTPLDALPLPAAEIDELRWLDPTRTLPDNLAPLLRTRILPELIARGDIDGSNVNEGAHHPWDTNHLEGLDFVYPGPERDRIVADICAGNKTATSSLLTDYEDEATSTGTQLADLLPRPFMLGVLLDSNNQRLGVIETTHIESIRLGDVTQEFARAEGEGFTSVADWRKAHENFWGDSLADNTLIVCEKIRYYPESTAKIS